MRYYYAAHYPYGSTTNTNTGRLIRDVWRFPSIDERDAFVARARTTYRYNSGYREPIPARVVTAFERARMHEREDAWMC